MIIEQRKTINDFGLRINTGMGWDQNKPRADLARPLMGDRFILLDEWYAKSDLGYNVV